VIERATNFREVHDRREAFYESRARVGPSRGAGSFREIALKLLILISSRARRI